MIDIAIKKVLDKLPVAELEQSLETFLDPLMAGLPERRLKEVVSLNVRGIIGSESPVVTQIAQQVARNESQVWNAAKRIYRFLGNQRFETASLSRGLYERSGQSVRAADPAHVVVTLDPVNFEKPYTTKLEGVSTVPKSRPPALNGQARLTRGYPAITATWSIPRCRSRPRLTGFLTRPPTLSAKTTKSTRLLRPPTNCCPNTGGVTWAMPGWMTRNCSPGWLKMNLSFEPATWNGESKSTMTGLTAGNRNICGTWWTPSISAIL